MIVKLSKSRRSGYLERVMKSGSRVWKIMDTSAEGNLRKCELLSQLIVHEIMSNVNFFGNTKKS